jgi:magnesium transporter
MTVVTIKRELLRFRRAAWPLREVLNYLLRDNVPGIHPATRVYIQDCYDHNMQIVDLLEAYRELASGLMEVYLSNVSYRMDQVMKVLTIISTIFIPLSFIASLYGMNFQTAASPWNMPELAWRYGYPYALGLMLLVALTMLFFFVRRGWIHPLRVRDRDADTLPAAPG